MIKYDNFTLANGLQVFVIPDPGVSIAAINILYDVGSKDEDENKTGFAHLFEHLMFGGSLNIPSYDEPLQKVGGENNAFTTPDYTNYYLTLPAANIETGFWLESDRMLSLSFDPDVLEVQRKVVIEEFKQRYLNRPYGDVHHHLRELIYTKHPYRWPTIGRELSHIETATMEDVKSFFKTHYVPNRAIMVVGGNVSTGKVKELSEKWFGPIPAGQPKSARLPSEPEQLEKRIKTVHADVPKKALFKAWKMGDRLSADYHAVDLLSDILGRGRSSRLHQRLVKELQLFTTIHASIAGSVDQGYFLIQGYLNDHTDFEEAEEAVNQVIHELFERPITDSEYEKVVNQALATLSFGKVELLEKCMSLAYFAMLGTPDLINIEEHKIANVSREDILEAAKKHLQEQRAAVLCYSPEKK